MGAEENKIQAQILDYLYLGGFYCWRNQQAMKKHYTSRYKINGLPDIQGVLKDGRYLGIEVKAPGGKKIKEQEEHIDIVSAMGGVAFFAESVQDVIDRFKAEGLLPKQKISMI